MSLIRRYPNLWAGCVGAWCPSVDRSRSDRLTDFSSYNNHGTLTSMDPATDWVASEGKIALDFDGTNDYVNATPFKVLQSKVLTMAGWVYRIGTGASQTPFGIFNTTDRSCIYIDVDSSAITILQFTSGAFSNAAAAHTTTANKWQHIAVALVDTACEVYLNGVGLSRTLAGAFPTINTVRIGAFCDTGGAALNYFTGQLDDVRIYNRALSPAEIRTLAQRRGIAYETKRVRVGSSGSTPLPTYRRNNMLIGCGF